MSCLTINQIIIRMSEIPNGQSAMIPAILRFLCLILIVVGLLWIYTAFYGGPLEPVFSWLNEYLPPEMQLRLPSTPLKPVTGV
jgi:hypothetical protein